MNRVALLGMILFSGCAASYTQLAPEERYELERTLVGNPNQALKLSYYVTPFFGDGSKRFLTAIPPEDVRLIEGLSGKPISPGAVEGIVPAGTRARITRIEFPTAFAVSQRVLYTPRTLPWLFLEVEGLPRDKPLILVLRPGLRTRAQVIQEVERYVTSQDLAARLSEWPEFVRSAVRSKQPVEGMPSDALEMAWGYPEVKKLGFDGSVRREEWTYPGGRRKASVANGRLERASASPSTQ